MQKSILLIGMPGSGKTTLGLKLSETIGYDFIDMDEFIHSKYKKNIEELFSQGEDIFRDIESAACMHLSKLNNVIISSGGGIVKRELNMLYFKEFLIIFINRPLELIMDDIEISTRPLLQKGKDTLINLYNERIDLYNKYKDIEVLNNNTIDYVINSMKVSIKNENNDN